jgi:hypothetical protein
MRLPLPVPYSGEQLEFDYFCRPLLTYLGLEMERQQSHNVYRNETSSFPILLLSWEDSILHRISLKMISVN